MQSETEQTTVPYVPFRTFMNSLDLLRQDKLPSEINRSIWTTMSGAMAGQLLAAYRFLGLIDSSGKPLAALIRLHSEADTQQRQVNDILRRAYADILALRLETCTVKQLDDAFDQYGVTGATHRKAVSFFVQAAQYAELPLSTYLTRRRGRKRRNGRQVSKPDPTGAVALADSPAPQGTSKTIKLKSGGSLTVSVTFDAFAISQDDRNFVFGIVDQLAKYDRTPAAPRFTERTPVPPDEGIGDDDVPF